MIRSDKATDSDHTQATTHNPRNGECDTATLSASKGAMKPWTIEAKPQPVDEPVTLWDLLPEEVIFYEIVPRTNLVEGGDLGLQILLEKLATNSKTFCCRILQKAVRLGYLDVVKNFARRNKVVHSLNPFTCKSIAESIAIRNDTAMIVALLDLPEMERWHYTLVNSIFLIAIRKDATAIAEKMIGNPLLQPSGDDNLALYHACLYNRTKIIRLLLEDDRVVQTMSPGMYSRTVQKHARCDLAMRCSLERRWRFFSYFF